MSNQAVFTITAEFVTRGESQEEMWAEVIAAADEIYELGPFETAHVVIHKTDRQLMDGSSGVFCDGCDGYPIAGVYWPVAKKDDPREWVVRCDVCSRYSSDEEALERVKEYYEGAEAIKEYGFVEGMGYHIEVG